MTRALVTTCTAAKSRAGGDLPAIDRYLGPRVDAAARRARAAGLPLFFLSGRYGLIPADRPIPWYDEALVEAAVDALVPRVAAQLARHGVTAIEFLAEPPETPGWAPYWNTLERAASASGIPWTSV